MMRLSAATEETATTKHTVHSATGASPMPFKADTPMGGMPFWYGELSPLRSASVGPRSCLELLSVCASRPLYTRLGCPMISQEVIGQALQVFTNL